MPFFVIGVPRPPSANLGSPHVDYGLVEAANERLARTFSAPIVRWDVGRLVARPCDDPPQTWISVGDRLRYDTLLRMPKSVLSTADRRFIDTMRGRRPLT